MTIKEEGEDEFQTPPFKRVREIQKIDVKSVRPPASQSAHMEQLGSQWKDFHEI